MKRIVIAPDSFKESLSSPEAAARIAEGVRKVLPNTEIIEIPLSDGGEGLTKTIAAACGGRFISADVTGPLGTPVPAFFAILEDGETAVMEMASASGLMLVQRALRNPLLTTTFGTGELIVKALDAHCRTLIVGIGGSATNDGGAGMAQALGYKLLNSEGESIGFGASELLNLNSIDASEVDPRLKESVVVVACDVNNPLCGPKGAAYVYAPQKGAAPDMLPLLDQALEHLATVIERDLGLSVKDLPGSGAGGGLGAGLMAFAGGHLQKGIDLVLKTVNFEDKLKGADLVITGEGEINAQSLHGKVPIGVAQISKKLGIPVLAIVGSIGPGAEHCYQAGIDGIMTLAPGPITLEESIARTGELLTDATERALRLILMRQ
ncbi:MAG: glycerate kinase [Ignavibacteriales bacterium]